MLAEAVGSVGQRPPDKSVSVNCLVYGGGGGGQDAPSPVSPCEGIEAITSPEGPVGGGANMQHCARSYMQSSRAVGRTPTACLPHDPAGGAPYCRKGMTGEESGF